MSIRRMAYLLATLALSGMAFAQDPALDKLEAARTQKLTEEKIIEFFRTGPSVASKETEALAKQTQLQSSLTNEAYQARLTSSINFQRSEEEAQNLYQPVLSPYQDWSAGIEKALPIGAKLGVEVYGSKYSFKGGPVYDATQMGVRTKAQIDLWKNIFGALDRAQLRSAESRRRRSEVEYALNMKRQEIELRKAFWSFVAASRSVDLANELIKTATVQLKDAQNRRREGVADRGEVARYQSQVESRNASRLLFMYQREVTLQTFEKQFDNFRSSQWSVDQASLQAKQPQIEQCIQKISTHQTPNLQYTDYDELIGLLKVETDAELRAAEKHSDMDLALVGQYQTTGVDTSFDRAREELTDETRGGYAVGLQLSIPLGSTKKTSEKLLLKSKKDSLEAQSERLANELRSNHETMLKALLYLTIGLKNQVENSRNLSINYQEMQKKYRQGRIPVSTLVLEQDSLFQSQLTEIDLRKQISHLILDYFSVFRTFPCDWNTI